MEHTVEKEEKHLLKLLKGKKVKDIYYMSQENADRMMWHSRPIIIEFYDGTILVPMRDSEGNDGGCMAIENAKKDISDIICTF